MKNLIKTALVASVFCGILSQPAQGIEVVGNNEPASYIGTGGLLLPSSFTGGDDIRKQVAKCEGCTWAYTIYCSLDNLDLCQHAVTSCPVGEILYRVWFGTSKSSATVVGSVCWGSGNPPTRVDIERRIADLVITSVPALKVDIAPPDGSITAIPVIAWVNQPAIFKPPPFYLAGLRVSITANASWRWIWGDGTIQWCTLPGLPYPSTQITHLYRNAGLYNLQVSTFWQASYEVDQIGTFATAGEVVTQNDQIPVRILQATTVLMK